MGFKFVRGKADELVKAEVVDIYGGDRVIIRKKSEGKSYIYSQINLSDGYWVEPE